MMIILKNLASSSTRKTIATITNGGLISSNRRISSSFLNNDHHGNYLFTNRNNEASKKKIFSSSSSSLSSLAGIINPSTNDSSSSSSSGTIREENKKVNNSYGYFSKLYNQYSITEQQNRIIMADRLFRFAQIRADDPRWYGPGRIGRDFRPRHAMLTMHLWFLQKRLIKNKDQNSLLTQEELFEVFWDDTLKRIRAEGLSEMTINKHLKDVQQFTFQHLTHYDHAFAEYELKPKARYEEICGIVWIHILQRAEKFNSDQVQRLAFYIDAQFNNIHNLLPEEYWKEGQMAWIDIPSFKNLTDNATGEVLPEKTVYEEDVLPKGWYKALTTAGEPYYWNPTQVSSQWEKPTTTTAT